MTLLDLFIGSMFNKLLIYNKKQLFGLYGLASDYKKALVALIDFSYKNLHNKTN